MKRVFSWCVKHLRVNKLFVFLFMSGMFLLLAPAFILSVLFSPAASFFDKKEAAQKGVLAEKTEEKGLLGDLSFNIPATFNEKTFIDNAASISGSLGVGDTVSIDGEVIVNNRNLTLGTGELTASNVIYSLTAGDNITITGGQNAVISADFIPTTLQGESGDLVLVEGSGITIDGLEIINSDPGSAQDIFKTIDVDGTTFSASGNTDTLTFAAGSGISLSADTSGKEITIAASGGTSTSSQWTTSGSNIYYNTGSVGIGNTSPTATLHVTGTSLITGAVTLSNLSTGIVHSNSAGLLSSSALNLAGGSSEVTGTLPIGNGGTGVTGTATDGQLLIGNGSGYTLATLTAGSGVTITNGSGSISIAASAGSGSNWTQANGTLSPNNNTLDMLIGGTATSSAKFGVLNVNSGTPTASLSAGTAGGAYLTAAGTLQTTANQTLTLGGSSTGNISLNPQNGSGRIILNAGSLTMNGSTGSTSVSPTCVSVTNGIVTGTGDCGPGQGGSVWTFNTTDGTLYPINNTMDLLIGGTATSSAKFAVLNVAGGTPTASVSAGSAGGSYLTATGTLQSTANQTLTIGGNTTGNITLSPLNGSGTVLSTGDLNLSSGKVFQINGTSVLSSSTLGTGVTASSLTSVGTLTSGTWNATAIGAQYGGTGINTSASTGVPSISAGTWSVNAQLPLSLGGTNANLTAVNGGIVYSNASALAISAAGNSGQCLTSGGAGTPTWQNCALGSSTNWWNQTNGALYPINSTVDFLVGGQASTSAKFAVLNVNNGTPTASVSAGTAGAAYLTATGTLQTTANQTLTLGGNTTGNITLSPLNGSGTILSTGTLNLSSGKTYQINGTDVLSSSTLGSGVTASSLTSVGTLTSGTWNATAIGTQYGGTGINTSASTGVPSISGGTWSVNAQLPLSLGGTNANLTAVNGGIVYSGASALAISAAGNSGQCLTSGGAGAPTWGDCATGTSFWNQANGALSPINSTVDLLIGGTATTSAKFAVLNVNNGTPTASVSAGTTGAAYLTAAGTIQTTANQTLNIGGNTTGNIILNPLNGTGSVGIGISDPGAPLHVNRNSSDTSSVLTNFIVSRQTSGTAANGIGAQQLFQIENSAGTMINAASVNSQLSLATAGSEQGTLYFETNNAGTLSERMRIDYRGNVGINTTSALATLDVRGTLGTTPAASFSAQSAFPALVVDNNGVGDLFTASKSGATHFVITNAGNVGIGTRSPDQKLDVVGNVQIKDAETATKAYRFRTNGSNLDLEAGGAHLYVSNWSGADFTGTQYNYLVLESGANIARAVGQWQWRTSAEGTTRHSIDGTTGASVVFNDNAEATNLTIEGDTDASLFYADGTNDRVGIGTTTPLAKLDVRGGTGANSGTVPVASVSGQTARAALVVDQTGVGDIFTASKSGTTRFVISNNGDVGIGTSLPGAKIDITRADTTTAQNLRFSTTSGTDWLIGQTTSTNDLRFWNDNLNDYPLSLTTTGKFGFGSGNTSPTGLLDVNGKTTGKALAIFNETGDQALFTASASGTTKFTIANSGNVGILKAPTTASLDVGGTSNFENNVFMNQTDGGFFLDAFNTFTTGIVRDTSANLFLRTSSTDQLGVYTTGKVGIGNVSTVIGSGNIPNGSLVIDNGILCVDNDGDNCDDAARTAGQIYAESATITAIDLAENFPSKDETLQPGEIVVADPTNTEYIKRSDKAYQGSILGVVSTKPGIILGGFGDETKRFGSDKKYPIALAGRIPVKVSTANGPIKPGDHLAASEIPGVAMKATRAGQTAAKAVEAYDNADSSAVGTIIALVNVSWYDPDVYLTDTGNFNIFDTGNANHILRNPQGKDIFRAGVFSDVRTAKLSTGSLDVQEFTVKGKNLTELVDTSASTTGKIATIEMQLHDMQSKIASLEASLSFGTLSPFKPSTPGELNLDKLDFNKVTISDTLNVLGRTTVTDLGITGNLTAGILSLTGLGDDGDAHVNTVGGDLKLQDLQGGGIDILAGKVKIEQNGNVTIKEKLTAKVVATTKLNITEDPTATKSPILSASAGVAVIPAGQSSLEIKTTALTEDSLIFATPDEPVSIGTKAKDDDTFIIKLQSPTLSDLRVKWWIVN